MHTLTNNDAQTRIHKAFTHTLTELTMKAVAQGAGDAHTRVTQKQRVPKLGALAGELSRREVLRARPAPPAFTNHLLNL
ncbi:unnamed protein product [Arctia plantaginis]|uniref:Uncharacterized protein n=1 Tax=Arctia plantaginis TaxID=874455 RepID=A0A8S1AMA8_ARCPL|nr:unnamed protein product [Arctia plantaginis]